MPTVYRIGVKTTRGEKRGKFRVTLTAKEGTYALSVPQTVFGKLMYKIVKQKPLTIDFGRKGAVQLKAEDLNIKGIKPIGKTASQVVKYVPIRPTPPHLKEKRRKKKTAQTQTTPPPTIPEITSAVFSASVSAEESTKKSAKKGAARSGRKGGKKKATAIAA
jgi:hypothetical protein